MPARREITTNHGQITVFMVGGLCTSVLSAFEPRRDTLRSCTISPDPGSLAAAVEVTEAPHRGQTHRSSCIVAEQLTQRIICRLLLKRADVVGEWQVMRNQRMAKPRY
jgi:hypothetical protein